MIAIPAVDLRDRACVQLVGGEYAAERIRLPDPIAVALDWEAKGFQALHIVDLDAATGRGDNRRVIERLLDRTDLTVQVGGGVRDRDAIAWLLDAGATYVVVGTRALEDEEWLVEMAEDFPEQLIVAADVRERKIVTRGWTRTMHLDIDEAMERLSQLPLAGVLVTAVHKEGLMQGADLALMEDVAESTDLAVIASGGIATDVDLRLLADRGVAAAVLGMALYTGALDARAIAEEFRA
jgi:phosphoribosylformimino-5-aminoimidazole carboxamide ribotide isomerase